MLRQTLCVTGVLWTFLVPASTLHARVAEPTLARLQVELQSGRRSAESVTRRYLARVSRLNPRLHAVVVVNPRALAEARASDARRAAGHLRGPLDGIPLLLKDNIDVAGGMPTTAGSLALAMNVPARDAGVVVRLRQAGLVILGKTNLSEWANFRSTHSVSGWSAVGGLTHNPYALDRTACGSSSGSAAGVAAGFAPLAVGTETDGSITCPAAMTGLVGLKPTVGLVSRSGIVPISRSQDTAGPMTHTVREAAALLQVISGPDERDPATAASVNHRASYADELTARSLEGARIGVLRFLKGYSPGTLVVYERALQLLRSHGAVLVDIDAFDLTGLGSQEHVVLLTEFKAGVDDYLAGTPKAVLSRSLDDVIAFNRAEPRELAWFDQDLFELAAATHGLDDPQYIDALRAGQERAGSHGIDRLLKEGGLIALVAPTAGPAWSIDRINGDPDGGGYAGKLSAVSGYPHLTVPMGRVSGMPVGLSFIGAAWSESTLLSLGFAFEQAVGPAPVPRLE